MIVEETYLAARQGDFGGQFGQQVEFTTDSHPGEVFRGRISFIDPVLNERTRSVKVRVNVANEDMRLKPGMFVRAVVQSKLATSGVVFDPSLAGKWISPMHPEVVKDGPGQCDVCGMDLVPAETLSLGGPQSTPPPAMVIPATTPLITGKRAVVYVRVPTSADLHREISAVWRLAGRPENGKGPTAKKPPTFDKLAAAIDSAHARAEELKAWRDAAETPPKARAGCPYRARCMYTAV